MTFVSISDRIKAAALEVGFDLCGVAPNGDFRELEYFPQWIDEGRAGEMHYLAARNEAGSLKRASLANAAPWAKSVIVCAINYNSEFAYSTQVKDKTRGWISRYAWTETDYHDAVLARLRLLETNIGEMHEGDLRTWCYVDTGPLVERVFAQHSGIGWVGKNTCIINQQIGSWLFLGVILTSIELAPDAPAPDRCGTCTACLDACPTQAFLGPYQLDATKCISYLTIEKRGSIPEELRPQMGNHLFGCDICQDVCPWNREAAIGSSPEFAPRAGLQSPRLDWIAAMSVEDFRETFRRSPVKRAKFSGLRRNAAIAMGNSADQQFIPHLRKLAEDEDPAVAEHARWAFARLHHCAHENDTLETEQPA